MSLAAEVSRSVLLQPTKQKGFQGLIQLITSVIEVINVVEKDGKISKDYKLELVQLQGEIHDTLTLRFPTDDSDIESESAQVQQESCDEYKEYKDKTREVMIRYTDASADLELNVKKFKEIMGGIHDLSIPSPPGPGPDNSNEIDTSARTTAINAIADVNRAGKFGKKLDPAKFRSIMSKFFPVSPQGAFPRFRILPKLRIPWRANEQDIVDRVNRASISMMSGYTGDINPRFASTRHSEAQPRPSAISNWDFGDDQSNQSEGA